MSRLLLSTVLLAACTSAAPSLTRVTPEPAGAHCATGGSAIATGVDANGNGQLDDAEVDDVAYQCTTQPPVLVREDDEPAGANCADGGTAVRVGHDTNGDGRLDDVEIEQTSYACAPEAIWEGDLTIDLAHDDLTALRDLRVVTGDLHVAGVGAGALPSLEVVGGEVSTAFEVTSLDLPMLASIGRGLRLEGGHCTMPSLRALGGGLLLGLSLDSFEAPSLVSIDGGLGVIGDLAELDLPALETIGGDLQIGSTRHLHALALGALTRVGGSVAIQYNDALPAMTAASLEHVGGGLSVASNKALTAVSFPALAEVGGAIDVSSGAVLHDVDLGALAQTTAGARIEGEQLARVNLGALHFATDLEIMGNVGALGGTAPGSITSLDLHALVSARTVALRGFGAMPDLDLPALSSVSDRVFLEGLGDLTAIRMPALQDAADIWIQRGAHLQTLQVGGASPIRGLAYLSLVDLDLTGLTSVTLPAKVASSTWFSGCTALDLRALASLRETGRLRIRENPALVDLAGLDPALAVGALEIVNNNNLTSLDGLEALDHVAGGVTISSNDRLADLAGLGHVEVIGGDLDIGGNATLTDLHGLGLRAIGGALDLGGNDHLTSLHGLESLTTVGGAVTTSYSPIPAAEVAALLAQLGR